MVPLLGGLELNHFAVEPSGTNLCVPMALHKVTAVLSGFSLLPSCSFLCFDKEAIVNNLSL